MGSDRGTWGAWIRGLGRFERIPVSDTIGSAKPGREAYGSLLRQGGHHERVLFVDDQVCNVEAARQLGISALHAHADRAWIDTVDDLIKLSPAKISS